jgi:hypothetical protein
VASVPVADALLGGSTPGNLAYAAQLALGGVFAASAFTKLRAPRRFVSTVSEYDLLPTFIAGPMASGVIVLETLLAVALLGSFVPRVALPIATVTLAAFLFVVAVSLHRGQYVSCGCFGENDEAISDATLVRLALLIAAAVFAYVTLLTSGHSSVVPGRGLLSGSATVADTVVTLALVAGALSVGSLLVNWRATWSVLSAVGRREPEEAAAA